MIDLYYLYIFNPYSNYSAPYKSNYSAPYKKLLVNKL